jgi:ribonuclease HI
MLVSRRLVYYTDGAWRSSSEIGAWAWIGFNFERELCAEEYTALIPYLIKQNLFASNSAAQRNTSNNKMEITAFANCIQNIPIGAQVDIYSDSEYVLKTIANAQRLAESAILDKNQLDDGWYRSWQNTSFAKKKNLELWHPLIAKLRQHCQKGTSFRLFHVNGHSGNPGNEAADNLANLAMDSFLKS